MDLITLSGNLYSTPLTVEGKDSLISIKVKCIDELPADHTTKLRYRVYLLVDTSGSMFNSINELKYTILTLCDEIEKSVAKGLNVQFTLINFNTNAEILHTGPISEDLRKKVMALKADGQTNLGEALELTILQMKADTCGVCVASSINQVIILTDGNPNMGRTSLPELKSLLDERPVNSIVEILGYTSEPNSKLLEHLAHYTMVRNLEMASGAIGSIMSNCLNTIGFNATIVLSDDLTTKSYERSRSGSIERNTGDKGSPGKVARLDAGVRDVIGSASVLHLYAGKEYYYGLAYKIDGIENIKKGTYRLTYVDLTGETRSLGPDDGLPLIPSEDPIPEDLLKIYYVHSSIRLITAIRRGNPEFVRERIQSWFPCGKDIANELTKMTVRGYHFSREVDQMISTMGSNAKYQVTHLPSDSVKEFSCFLATQQTFIQSISYDDYFMRHQGYTRSWKEFGFDEDDKDTNTGGKTANPSGSSGLSSQHRLYHHLKMKGVNVALINLISPVKDHIEEDTEDPSDVEDIVEVVLPEKEDDKGKEAN